MFFQAALPPPKPVAKPVPGVIWSYATPPGFQLLEPGYRFPVQIKQALVQFVQPDAELSRAYQDVFADKKKFAAWFRGVLLDQKKKQPRAAESSPTVLSSDLSKLSVGNATVTSTAKIPHPKAAAQDQVIDRYLFVLKTWAPEK
ncbi:MAG TPA: hypothetical protein VF378_07535 [Geothrix sp.]